MSKWWSVIGAIVASVTTAVTPAVQNLLGKHPVVDTVIASAIAVILHWLPSPASQPPVNLSSK